MSVENPRIKKIREVITTLENLRDRLLEEGQGPFMSDSLFKEIDRLHKLLLEEMRKGSSEPPGKK